MENQFNSNLKNKCGEIYIEQGKFSYNCFVCSIIFADIEHFTNHVLDAHYLKIECNEESKDTDYISNVEYQSSDDQSQNTLDDSKIVKKETQSDPLVYNDLDDQCSVDLSTFNTELNIKAVNNVENNEVISEKPIRYHCKSCTKSFLRAHHLEKHEKKHAEGDLTCKICGKQLRSKASLRIHVRTHTNEKPYKCSHCEAAFGDQASLIRHTTRTHPETRQNKDNEFLNCQFCSRKYQTQWRLQRHEKLHINEEFRCKVCGKNMKTRQALMVHVDIHNGERRYKCDLCPKSFKASSNLSDHKRRHNGEKPFKCEHCDLRFFFNCKLKVHQRIHTGEKPIVCEVCGKTFSQISRLSEHMLRHTNTRPYQCDICSKSFFNSALLNTHKSVHSNERNFQCEVCSLTFKLKKTLKVHKQTHSQTKNYKCKSCTESFISYSALNYHTKSHSMNLLSLK